LALDELIPVSVKRDERGKGVNLSRKERRVVVKLLNDRKIRIKICYKLKN